MTKRRRSPKDAPSEGRIERRWPWTDAGGRDKVRSSQGADVNTAGIVRDRPPDDGTGIDSIVTMAGMSPSESRSPSPRRRSRRANEHRLMPHSCRGRVVRRARLAAVVAARQTPDRHREVDPRLIGGQRLPSLSRTRRRSSRRPNRRAKTIRTGRRRETQMKDRPRLLLLRAAIARPGSRPRGSCPWPI